MGEGAFVTGKAMICSIGETPGEIVEAVRHRRIKLQHLPFTLAGLPYTRPYYLIMRNEGDRPENRSEGYFAEILFSTVAHAIADAGLSDGELAETHLFFGSTSMDVPVFEGGHHKTLRGRVGAVPPLVRRLRQDRLRRHGALRDRGVRLYLHDGVHLERQRLPVRRRR